MATANGSNGTTLCREDTFFFSGDAPKAVLIDYISIHRRRYLLFILCMNLKITDG